MSLYLQYGCGMDAPKGWVNYDASPTLYYERIPILGRLYTKNKTRFPEEVRWGDIVRGLPHEKESVQGIFCSHVLEHLSLEDCRIALRRSYEYLKPGGIFRMVLPDLWQAVEQYCQDSSPRAAHTFMETTLLGCRSRGGWLRRALQSVFGNSKHLWMWDEKAMIDELQQVGFKKIRRAFFGDSQDERFREVEREDRFKECLALEAIK